MAIIDAARNVTTKPVTPSAPDIPSTSIGGIKGPDLSNVQLPSQQAPQPQMQAPQRPGQAFDQPQPQLQFQEQQQQQTMQQRPEPQRQEQQQQRPQRPATLIAASSTAEDSVRERQRADSGYQTDQPAQAPQTVQDSQQPWQPQQPSLPQTTRQQMNFAAAVSQAIGPQRQTTTEVVEEQPLADPQPDPSASTGQATMPPTTDDGVTRDEYVLEDPEPKKVADRFKPQRKNIANAKAFAQEKQKRKEQAAAVGKRAGRGNGVSGVIVSDPNVSLREISFGTREMLAAFAHPESMLRDLVAEHAPDADLGQMAVDDAYASQVIKQMFNEGEINLLVSKYPTPDEASSHVRTVRVHDGKEAALHPLAAKMFNADADGDTIKASFDVNETAGAKTAMDFLVGTDNEIKVDDSFFQIRRWGDIKQTEHILREMLAKKRVEATNVSGLAKAIDAAYRGDKDAAKSIMRWCRAVGDKYVDKETKDAMTSGALGAIYEYNQELWVATAFSAYAENGYQAKDSSWLDAGIPDWDMDLIEGSMPANQYDFLVSVGAPVGQVERKNTQFRMSANLAKRIKPDSRIQVGARKFKSKTDWTADAEELIAKKMSGIIAFGESRFGPATYIRSRVIKSTGAPRMYDSFKEFTEAFVKNYNFYQKVLDSAGTYEKTDGTIGHVDTHLSPIKYDKTNESVRAAFKGIYGEFTMESIFGRDQSFRGWEKRTLDDFVAESREAMLSDKTAVSYVGGFVSALRDMRTSQARKFDDQMKESLGKQFANGKMRLRDAWNRKPKHRDYSNEVNLLTEALYLLGRDAFSYYGFDHIDAFRSTDIGRRFLEAKNPDHLGGLVYEMQARYRLDDAWRAQKRGDLQALQERLDALASISGTWKAIVADMRDGGDVVNGILLKEDMGKAAKDRALNDLVKQRVSKKHSEFEVPYDLMGNPRGLYAGPRQSTDFNKGGLLGNFKASNEKIDASANEADANISDQVSKARAQAKPGQLSTFLGNVASGEAQLFDIEHGMYVDALTSSLEKTFASSEKSKQEDAVNTLYFAASHSKNGGVFSDLTACDDFFLGKMALDRFIKWPVGIAKILSDPRYSIEVYDGHGSETISRDSLVGGNSEADVWDFLERNPRVAMALRSHTVMQTKNGERQYTVARKDLLGTINAETLATVEQKANRRAFMQLVDHPGFGALVMLAQELTGKKRRQTRKEAERSIEALVKNIRELSEYDGYLPALVEEMIGDHLSRFRGREVVLGDGVYRDAETQLKAHITKCLCQYAAELKELNLPPVQDVPELTLKLYDDASVAAYFDTVQVLSGAKTAISTSINGAESQRNAVLAFLASDVPENCMADEYRELDSEQFQANWKDYERRKTDTGIVINETTYDKIIEEAENGTIRIEVPETCADPLCPCKRHRMADPSTNNDEDTQTTPLSRYMLDKRTFGTEALNLKVKTLGDDHTDSISKHTLFDADSVRLAQDIQHEIAAVHREAGMPAARRLLAKYLYQRNSEAGYDSLNEDDFANVAQAMIRERTNEDGMTEARIMSVEEMSAIVKERISEVRRTVDRLSAEEIVQESRDAILSYDPRPLDIDEMTAMVSVSRMNNTPYATVDETTSSVERNAKLIERLEIENGSVHDAARAAEIADDYLKDYPELKRMVPEGRKILGVVSAAGLDVTSVVGPDTLWIIKGDAEKGDIAKALEMADRLGATVMFHGSNDTAIEALAESQYSGQEHEIGNGRYLVPFFDIKLNGPATSGDQGAFNVGEYRIAPDELITFVEDPHNTERLTDADFQPLADMVERIHVSDTGRYETDVRKLFANLIEMNLGHDVTVRFPARVEIEAYVVREGTLGIPVDLGIMPNDTDIVEFEEQVERYSNRFSETDDNGWLPNAKPNEIVGWVIGQSNGSEAWAPVRMYPLGEGSSPDMLNVAGYGFAPADGGLDNGKLAVQWQYDSGVLGNSFKMFESWFAANKLMARPKLPKSNPRRQLRNGLPLDAIVAASSTSGRRLTYQMQQSMATLFAMARITGDGYNMADLDGTFPNDQEIRAGLQEGTLTIGDWKRRLENGPIEFFPGSVQNKPMMDAFANSMAEKAVKAGVNPTNVFASHFNGVPSRVWFRFNVLFDGSAQFQQNLMAMFNFIDESLCPADPNGDSSDTLFNGKLQMLVPFSTRDGSLLEDWAYVYTGLHFMDGHFSGLSTPGRNPISYKSTSVDNTLLYGGRDLDPAKIDEYLGWALADKPLGLSNTWLLNAAEDAED